MNADVVIPITTPSELLYLTNVVCLRTCRASTAARILVLDNNTPESKLKASIAEQCALLDIEYRDVPGLFNMNKFFNLGRDLTRGDYIAYCNSDLIFFPNWFENIVDLWQDHQDYFIMAPFSFDNRSLGVGYRPTTDLERRVIRTSHPNTGVLVFRRSDNYVFDENFPDWEQDADTTMFLDRNERKAGFCLNARVDHLLSVVRSNIDMKQHYGVPQDELYENGTKYLRTKWAI